MLSVPLAAAVRPTPRHLGVPVQLRPPLGPVLAAAALATPKARDPTQAPEPTQARQATAGAQDPTQELVDQVAQGLGGQAVVNPNCRPICMWTMERSRDMRSMR